MSPSTKPHFELLQGFPPDVVAISATGHITAADYETTLTPLVEARIRDQGKIKLLYVIGAGFGGFSAGAAWDDARLGFAHLGDFARMAVVTDVEWIRLGMKLFAPLLRCPVAIFDVAELEAAKAWIAEDGKPETGGPGVSVTHTLPLMEDKTPEQ